MKRIISFAMALFMVLSIAPLSLAVPVKDETLDPVLNGEGGTLEFVNDETYPWEIAEVDGVQYAKSTTVNTNYSSTQITTTTNVGANSVISFDYIVSTEQGYDFFEFGYTTPDNTTGVKLLELSGEQVDTFTHTFQEDIANCTFHWRYTKDYSSQEGQDCVYIGNVLLGGAAEVEGINIVEESIQVLMGNPQQLTIQFIPATASGTVEWQSSNTEIATVENGIVTPVAEGDVVITATCGEFSDTVNVTVVADALHVDGFRIGSVMPYVRFSNYILGDGVNTFVERPFGGLASNVTAAEYFGGELFVALGPVFYRVNYENGSADEIRTDTVNRIRALSYDYANGRMLAYVAGDTNYIASINLETGMLTKIVETSISSNILAMAVNHDGVVYVLAMGGTISRINLETAELTPVMDTGVLAQYINSMTFDHNTGLLYWAACSDNEETLYEINLETQTKRAIANNFGMVSGLHMVYDEEVAPPTTPVLGVELDRNEISLLLGGEDTLSAYVYPEDATNKEVTWRSSNPAAVTVDNGNIKAVGLGIATIIVETVDGGYSSSCEVTVEGEQLMFEDFEDALSGWTVLDADDDDRTWGPMSEVAPNSEAYAGNDMYTSLSSLYSPLTELSMALYPDNWLISPEFTISDIADKVILSWIAGSGDPEFPDYYTIYVGQGEAIAENFTTVIYVGYGEEPTQLFAEIPAEYAGQTVRIAIRHFLSDNRTSINIDNVQIAQTQREGSTVIPVTSVTLDKTEATMLIGATETLTATVLPENATNRNVTWTTSNSAVATVTNGVVTAKGVGTAIITVTTVNGLLTATCEVTVAAGDTLLHEDFEDEPTDWTFVDADGDGHNWISMKSFSTSATIYEGNDMYTSQSYAGGAGALDPDNWMISPEFTINEHAELAQLSWIAGSQYESYPDHYVLYIGTGSANPSTFTTILLEDTPIEAELMTVDLMAYAGQTVRIAFRHCDSYDCYMLNIDDIKVVQLVDAAFTTPVTGVSLDRNNVEMTVGDVTTLTATVMPEDATNKSVTWTSSNTDVVTVAGGTVTAVAPGNAVITVTTVDGNYTATCSVTVEEAEPGEFILYEDFEDALQGWTIIDADGDGYCWTSMNQLSGGGIPAYEGNDMFTSQSYINQNEGTGQPSQALNPDNWLISPEFTIGEGATRAILSWMAGSQDHLYLEHYSVYIGVGDAVPETFTTVLYTGNAPGTPATRTANILDYAGQTVRVAFRHHDSADKFMINIDLITVEVLGGEVPPTTVDVTGVTLDTTSAEMNIGDTLALTATVLPENATNKNVVWSTSNEAVATVANGTVTAVAEGTAIITVTTEDGMFTATCTVTVNADTPEVTPVTGVTLDTESAIIIVGNTITLTATVMPENATNKNVVWSTSDENVATVENGVVTAVAFGQAVITVTTEDGAFTATCTINVYAMGDVTGDGMFNTGDAVAMLRKIAGLDNETYVAELEDYNGDGQFNTGDAVAILRKIAGLE